MAERLSSGGGKAHALELDVRSYPSFARAVTEAVKRCGRIDYLFNNAGIDIVGEIDSYTLDDWNNVFDRQRSRASVPGFSPSDAGPSDCPAT
ncbi:MAG: hypothetical protein QOH27_5283 [Mycobacterium sp.]|nr:hypothetical protein [Mycobacterium sp.]